MISNYCIIQIYFHWRIHTHEKCLMIFYFFFIFLRGGGTPELCVQTHETTPDNLENCVLNWLKAVKNISHKHYLKLFWNIRGMGVRQSNPGRGYSLPWSLSLKSNRKIIWRKIVAKRFLQFFDYFFFKFILFNHQERAQVVNCNIEKCSTKKSI